VPKRKTAGVAGPITPATKESFDDLARRVARAEPRRGSIVQPPPAWEPDEVTLGFAMVSDASGEIHELPEATLLATILIAVETDRRRILNRLTGGLDEEIDAIASLFWPFLILHGRTPDEVAIFDGTGVWNRTFRYTVLPSMDGVKSLVDSTLPPQEHLTQMRTLSPYFAQDAGAEVLTVEGFLPLDPPLLFDVLSQSQFRTDPQSPHSGFLPARHKVDWYSAVTNQMYDWLDRFERDLRLLGELRGQVDTVVRATQARLDEDYRKKSEESQLQVQAAIAQSEAQVAQLQAAHHAEIQRYLEAIRRSQTIIAHGEATVATTEALAFRATHRRMDAGPHLARGKDAQAQIRTANRQIAESRRAIEKIHEHQRADQEQAVAQVIQVEAANARALAGIELFRDDYLAAGLDLLQSIDGQVAARSTQRNLLASYFLPLPSLASISVVWFPLWMATLRGSRGLRQIVFPPMQVRGGVGIGGSLKRLFGGIVLPLEPRTARFDKILRPTMEEALSRDPWLSTATQELTRAADVLVDPHVLERFQQGLAELKLSGWISRKQEEDFLQAYTERAGRFAGAGPAGHGPVPPGALADSSAGSGGPVKSTAPTQPP